MSMSMPMSMSTSTSMSMTMSMAMPSRAIVSTKHRGPQEEHGESTARAQREHRQSTAQRGHKESTQRSQKLKGNTLIFLKFERKSFILKQNLKEIYPFFLFVVYSNN